MSAAEKLTITVPSDLAEALRQTVADGNYASASEVIQEALLEWSRNREAGQRNQQLLQAAIQAGLESGKGFAAEEVFSELRTRYSEKS